MEALSSVPDGEIAHFAFYPSRVYVAATALASPFGDFFKQLIAPSFQLFRGE
jgi:hypothetical protein